MRGDDGGDDDGDRGGVGIKGSFKIACGGDGMVFSCRR